MKASATTASSAPLKKQDQEAFILSTVSDIEKEERIRSNDRASSRQTPSSASRGSEDSSGSQFWQELLSSPEPEMFGHRAKSASDAAVLRRKGHLKEQDKMIEFLLAMHHTHTSEEVMQKMDRWIMEHRQQPRHSRLKKMVPSVGSFFTPLKLVEAFREFDQFFALSRRKYVPPNFAEMRHILNIAQVTKLLRHRVEQVLITPVQHHVMHQPLNTEAFLMTLGSTDRSHLPAGPFIRCRPEVDHL